MARRVMARRFSRIVFWMEKKPARRKGRQISPQATQNPAGRAPSMMCMAEAGKETPRAAAGRAARRICVFLVFVIVNSFHSLCAPICTNGLRCSCLRLCFFRARKKALHHRKSCEERRRLGKGRLTEPLSFAVSFADFLWRAGLLTQASSLPPAFPGRAQ